MEELERFFRSLDSCYSEKYGCVDYKATIEKTENGFSVYNVTISEKVQKFKLNKLKNCKMVDAFEDDKYPITLRVKLKNRNNDNYFDSMKKEIYYDDSDAIWELHKKVYAKEIDKIKKDYFLVNKNNAEVSGDIVFNFNESKCKYFSGIIEFDNKCSDFRKNVLRNMLAWCSKFHHSPQNVSIMLKTGGLNSFKQGISNDRFDIFICEMEEYYSGKKLHILENGNLPKMSFMNRNELENNLDLFGIGEKGFSSFISFFYHIEKDSDVVKKLIKLGKKRIKECNDLYAYLCLAFEYWIAISSFYCKLDEVRGYYLDLDNAYPPGTICLVYSYFADSWKSVLV